MTMPSLFRHYKYYNKMIMKKFPLFYFCVIATISTLFGCGTDTNSDDKTPSPNTDTEIRQAATEKARLDSIALAEKKAQELALEEARIQAEKDSLANIAAEKERLALLEKEKKEKQRKAKLKKERERERKRKAQIAEKKKTNPKPDKKTGAVIEFTKTNYDFGTIKEGEVVKYEFEYTNNGTEDLIIMDAKVTCGCTAPGFSFFPLKPGLSSAISVSFNSKNKVGPQRPEITIFTNGTPAKQILTLNGVVTTEE